VDFVIIFEEDTPIELIKALKPNVLVKGGDYTASQVVGVDLVSEVIIIDLLQGHSTTKLDCLIR
jgi:D-beta-D-heptose 7-phosphate kinase/D-beta-D-heptose 1-phosphate adenosyltransferase